MDFLHNKLKEILKKNFSFPFISFFSQSFFPYITEQD